MADDLECAKKKPPPGGWLPVAALLCSSDLNGRTSCSGYQDSGVSSDESAGVGEPPMLKSGPPPPRPPFSSLGASVAASPAGAPSSRSESGLVHWAFLRERPIFRSPRSTRRIFTSISSPTFTTSSGLSTLWSASSEMCSRPSRPGSSSTKTPKLVSLVTLPLTTSFGS